MTFLDACAGLGGFALGLQMAGLRFDWQGYSEIDKDCEAVYAKHYPKATRLRDLARWREWGPAPGWLDIFSCGFPCPPFSVAGKRLGGDDPRNLWPVVAGAIRGLRPCVVLLENVPGILAGDGEQPAYFGRVLGDLAEAGYDAEWQVLSAKEVGASHRRERVFVVAHDDQRGRRATFRAANIERRTGASSGDGEQLAHDDSTKPQCTQGERPRPGDPESRRARGQPTRCREYLAHAKSAGAERDASQQVRRAAAGIEDNSGVVAVPRRGGRRADNEGKGETGRGRDSTAGDVVANTKSKRLEGRDNRGKGVEKEPGGLLSARPGEQPLFPPGPGDAEGWQRVLARWPELAPAVGGRLNVRFVEWLMGYPIGWCGGVKRSAALKALGNAVVPQCAAEAVRRMPP